MNEALGWITAVAAIAAAVFSFIQIKKNYDPEISAKLELMTVRDLVLIVENQGRPVKNLTWSAQFVPTTSIAKMNSIDPQYLNGKDVLTRGEPMYLTIGEVFDLNYLKNPTQLGAKILSRGNDALAELATPIYVDVVLSWDQPWSFRRGRETFRLNFDHGMYVRSSRVAKYGD